MALRLSSFEDMPEEEYVAAFAELTKLCDITIAIHAKKAEKCFESSPQMIRRYSNSQVEGYGSEQPPARYVRKSKSKLSQTDKTEPETRFTHQ